eukprot:310360-Rhodomonas_salina.1
MQPEHNRNPSSGKPAPNLSALLAPRSATLSEDWVRAGEDAVSCMRSADMLLEELLVRIQSNCQAAV